MRNTKTRRCFVLFLLSFLLAVSLFGYGQPVQREGEQKEVPSMFVMVEETGCWAIVYHSDSRVMYAVSAGNSHERSPCL